MMLLMSGLDHGTAGAAVREQLSFSGAGIEEMDELLISQRGITGAVLLSTCNRTELYLTCDQNMIPGEVLCRCAGKHWSDFAPYFYTLEGMDAARHLMEVAAGLKSAIWGEDQIITQVGQAMERARSAGSMSSVLSRLCQTAVAAGKEIKTQVRFRSVPSTAASQAVRRLEQELNGLSGKRAVVIGNGIMGRLAARALRDAGAEVAVTLRTYRHGETIVPHGCNAIPYSQRLQGIDGADILFSATTSPHYTFTAEQADMLERCPPWFIDLSIPRDIDPLLDKREGVHVLNVDDLGLPAHSSDSAAEKQAELLIEKHLREFYQWLDYREAIPVMGELKEALCRRFQGEELTVEETVSRTVDLLLGGFKGKLKSDDLQECASKINAFTRPNRKKADPQNIPFRFPVFTDLRGRKVVVIGGGTIARRRIDTLLPFGADIHVISPSLLGTDWGITWHKRPYQPGDLTGAFLAIAATDQRAVNHAVFEEAQKKSIPVSVADDREECTFFFPAICTGEKTLAGVVSRGDDHRETATAARSIRMILQKGENSQ